MWPFCLGTLPWFFFVILSLQIPILGASVLASLGNPRAGRSDRCPTRSLQLGLSKLKRLLTSMCRWPLPHVFRSFNNDLECFSAIRSLYIISPEWAGPVSLCPPWPISSPVHSPMLLVSSRTSTLLHVGPWHHFPYDLDKGTCRPRFNIFCPSPRSFTPSWSLDHLESCSLRVLSFVGLHDVLTRCLMNFTRKSPCWGVRKSDGVPKHKVHEQDSQGLRNGDKESPKACTRLKSCESLFTCPRTAFYRETNGLLHYENTLESKEYS
jgi:hypothetical protein